MSLLELFYDVDNFTLVFEQWLKAHQLRPTRTGRRGRPASLAMSEVMTIMIYFHQSHYRDFKAYYTQYVCQHLRADFPKLVSYNRFVELIPATLLPLCLYLVSRRGQQTGINFIDSTPIAVCHNKRIRRHKVFAGLARRGKSSLGWFYGFKLHLIVNDQGEIIAFCLTPGNVDDRDPVPTLARELWGKLVGDRGYLDQTLFEQLWDQQLQLITPVRKNMPNRLMPLMDKLLVRKRALIETINDQLKNISQIAHTRHRSVCNFAVNLLAGLIAYTWQPKKPSIQLSDKELALLPNLI
ncbi:MAG TPA: IS982 family transposase [Anaerolineae bacterium]|nr:IS982 family transposase [Anaerolineae bacterium]